MEACDESTTTHVSKHPSSTSRQTSKSSSPSPGHFHAPYRPDIDGLRAVAVLAVVVYHAFPGWIGGGFVGVDIFFVISGFLISTVICNNLQRDSFSLWDFYGRRIRRIFPALLVVLVSCYAFGWVVLLAEEYKQLGKHMAAGAGFVSNLVLWNESGYFDTSAETKPLLHLWSLGIEEQFYIVWPALLWAAWKHKSNLLVITTTVIAVSFALNLSESRVDGVAAFYSPQTRFWELLVGSLLSCLRYQKIELLPQLKARFDGWAIPCHVLSVCGALLVVSSLMMITKEDRFPGLWAVMPVLGSVLIIAGGSHSWFNRTVLSNRMLVWLGVISYPVYLWHWPLLSFATIVEGELPTTLIRMLVVIGAILLAWLTYALVEYPLRFSKRARTTTMALIGIMIVTGYTGYKTFSVDGMKSRGVVVRNFDPDSTIPYDANPALDCSIAEVSEHVLCEQYLSGNPAGTLVMWGDSTAGMWLPVFLDVAQRTNINVIRIEHKSCPPILGIRKTRFDYPTSRFYCDRETQHKILNYIKSVKPDSVVVLSAWNSFSPYTNREFITDGSEAEANAATTQRAIENQVPMTLNELSKVGRVVVFKSWPFLPERPIYTIHRLPFLRRNKDIVRASYVEFKKDSEFIESVFEKIDSPVVYFDPAARICDADSCSSVYRQVKLYKDEYHISIAGAMQFRSDIAALIPAKSNDARASVR